MIVALAVTSLLCACIPAVLFFSNLGLYVEPPPASSGTMNPVSILIPARNEATGIAEAIEAVLLTRSVEFELIVMDDASTDGTAGIVREYSLRDARVRIEDAPLLPGGWNGKQHACWSLAHAARYPVLCFVDADVRVGPECVARMAQFLQEGGNGLVSGFPRQITGTFLEWMLLPLIHFVLLGFLPLTKMRQGTDPAFAAGCGQFMMARKNLYLACGGHSGIKLTMHDGLRLPRLFREAGFRTDLADLTNQATCRMYTSARQVWSGLAKNATEGLAAPSRIAPVTLLLLLGQVMPFLLLVALVFGTLLLALVDGALGVDVHFIHPTQATIFLTGLTISAGVVLTVRCAAARRFQQDWRSVLLHPLGIVLLLAVQWYAFLRQLRGGAVSWKDRAYTGD